MNTTKKNISLAFLLSFFSIPIAHGMQNVPKKDLLEENLLEENLLEENLNVIEYKKRTIVKAKKKYNNTKELAILKVSKIIANTNESVRSTYMDAMDKIIDIPSEFYAYNIRRRIPQEFITFINIGIEQSGAFDKSKAIQNACEFINQIIILTPVQ